MPSALLTGEIVLRTLHIIESGVQKWFIENEPERMVVAIVVLDPTVPYPDAGGLPVLWEGLIGEADKTKWPKNRDYPAFARGKALVSWRTGLPSHIVQRDSPHLFQHGDFKFGGSTVYNGIIVAASGLRWEHDLAVSGMVASVAHALTIGEMDKVVPQKTLFIGETPPSE